MSTCPHRRVHDTGNSDTNMFDYRYLPITAYIEFDDIFESESCILLNLYILENVLKEKRKYLKLKKKYNKHISLFIFPMRNNTFKSKFLEIQIHEES